MPKPKNNIFENFCGEYIQIRLNGDNKQSVDMGGKIVTVYSLNTVKGFLVDEDDEYFYIGHSPDSFSHAVKKRYVMHIGPASETEDEESDMNLDHLIDRPENDNGYN